MQIQTKVRPTCSESPEGHPRKPSLHLLPQHGWIHRLGWPADSRKCCFLNVFAEILVTKYEVTQTHGFPTKVRIFFALVGEEHEPVTKFQTKLSQFGRHWNTNLCVKSFEIAFRNWFAHDHTRL